MAHSELHAVCTPALNDTVENSAQRIAVLVGSPSWHLRTRVCAGICGM